MATKDLTIQNFFITSLKANLAADDTIIYLNEVPTGIEGYLVISPDDVSRKEIIYYTSVNTGAGSVTCPDVVSGRGLGGTTAISHIKNEPVKQNINAEYWKDLQSGDALGDDTIGSRHLKTVPFFSGTLESGTAAGDRTPTQYAASGITISGKKMIIPEAGTYLVQAQQLTSATATNPYFRITVNGAVKSHAWLTANAMADLKVAWMGPLAANDQVALNHSVVTSNTWGAEHASVQIIRIGR